MKRKRENIVAPPLAELQEKRREKATIDSSEVLTNEGFRYLSMKIGEHLFKFIYL